MVLTVAGCAGLDDPGSGVTPGGAGEEPDDAASVDVPLLQISRSGGFVPMGYDFATVPELTVYPDGRAVTHGPQIAIYPPPALPNLLLHRLDDADVDALVATARSAGLLEEPPGYGHPPVADAPTTFVVLHVDGRTVQHSADSLGFGDGTEPLPRGEAVGPGAPPPDGGLAGEDVPSGLTAEERDARVELAAFITRAHELVGAAGDGEQYRIEAFAVMARPAPDDAPADDAALDDAAGADAGTSETPPAADAGTVPAPDGEPERPVLAWPLDVPLTEAHDCVVVDGEPAGVLRDALAGASSTTLFEQGGVRYEAWFRPLLPHEEDCGDLGPTAGPLP